MGNIITAVNELEDGSAQVITRAADKNGRIITGEGAAKNVEIIEKGAERPEMVKGALLDNDPTPIKHEPKGKAGETSEGEEEEETSEEFGKKADLRKELEDRGEEPLPASANRDDLIAAVKAAREKKGE